MGQTNEQLWENRNTSSGLTFSIKWKPRTAETEEELDTVDLVDLLRQDPRLLKDSDLEKITVHFRSKIDKAKEEVENSSEMQTLLQVLKEVLDYRKWFSFVLYFQREGENRRELTIISFINSVVAKGDGDVYPVIYGQLLQVFGGRRSCALYHFVR